MSMRIQNDPISKTEQITKKPMHSQISGIGFNLETAKTIYENVKGILEKDEYNIFETRSKLTYDKQIERVTQDIDKLIKLNVRGKEEAKVLMDALKKISTDNDEQRKLLREKLS